MEKDVVVGQLAQNIKGKEWLYCVVTKVFDDRCEVINERGKITMVMLNNTDEEFTEKHISDGEVHFLYHNNKPVMAKKSIFGRYKFEVNK